MRTRAVICFLLKSQQNCQIEETIFPRETTSAMEIRCLPISSNTSDLTSLQKIKICYFCSNEIVFPQGNTISKTSLVKILAQEEVEKA